MFVPGNLRSTFALILFSFQSGCDPAIPPTSGQPLASVAILETSCTEAWVQVALHPEAFPRRIELRRAPARGGDTLLLLSTTLVSSETVIVDQSLLPSSEYSYSLTRPGSFVDLGTKATARTLDTTSHEFTWQSFLLGDGNSSRFWDVAIINDTTICAAGEVYLVDSTGEFQYPLYNSVWGNGTVWSFQRIPYIYQGHPSYSGLAWVYRLDVNDVWFDNSVRWNGATFDNLDLAIPIFYGIGHNKMCQLRNGAIVLVGNRGTIAISQDRGTSWRRIESGIDGRLSDIWPSKQGSMAIAVAGEHFVGGGEKVLTISETGVVDSLAWGLGGQLNSIWFESPRKIYVCGAGVFVGDGSRWNRVLDIPFIYTSTVRGTGTNDVVVAGAFGFVAHFNGVSWKTYADVALQEGGFNSVAYDGRTLVAVGRRGSQALLLIGRRQ
jgi:hypothetical protein